MNKISVSADIIARFESKALGQLIADELCGIFDDKGLKKIGDWFSDLETKQIQAFFDAVSDDPKPAKKVASKAPRKPVSVTRTLSPRKPKAAPKPVTPRAKRSKTPAELAAVRKTSRARSVRPAKQPLLPFASDEEEPKPTKLGRPPIVTGDQLAADFRATVLDYLKRNPSSAASTIERDCSLSAGQTKGLLKRLREQGSVRVEGKNRGARYSLAQTNGASAHA